MAKKSISAWKQIYKQAIEYMGGETTKRQSLKSLKRQWHSIRQEQLREGVELPNVQTVAKQFEYDYQATPRDENMNTLPPEEPITLASDMIEDFLARVKTIYEDTKNYIASAPRNSKGNVKDPEFYFLQNHEEMIDAEYREIQSIIESLRSQFPDEAIADALAKNVELDYLMAMVFIPPSDTQDNFAVTIEQLTAIMIDLSSQFLA